MVDAPTTEEQYLPAAIWLALAIISEVIATSLLKTTEGFTRFAPSLGVVLGYSAAFYCLSLALTEIPVGVAYAIWSGVGIILVCGIAWVVHGQRIDGLQAVGILLIVLGVAICRFRA